MPAFIFDMDDTLAVTAPFWRVAEETLLAAIGHCWTAELAAQYKGMNSLDVAATIHRLLRPALPLHECQRIMRNTLIEQFRPEAIRAVAGAVALVRRVAPLGPMAVASGSPPIAIERTLDALNIKDCFQRLLSSESVARGKPHPDVFLTAAEALQIPPAQCVVFEDSLIGAQAAQAAGMKCLVVPSLPSAELSAVATRVFNSWDEVDLKTGVQLV